MHSTFRFGLLLATALILPACGVSGGGSATLTPTVAPSAPESISTKSGNQRVTLDWTPSPAAKSYTVRRSTSSGGPYTAVADVTSPSFVDTGLTNTTPYYYCITASNPYGMSGNSDEIRVVPGLRPKVLSCWGDHTLLFLEDDTFWSVGFNDGGQLGPGAGGVQSSNIFVPAADFHDVTGLAEGWDFSLALRADGTVWAWGYNSYGTLGVDPATVSTRTTPEPVAGLDSVVAIAAASWYSLAIRSDGTVWSWGRQFSGELGRLPGQAIVYAPGPIPGLTDIVAVAAGYSHCLALKSDGTVWTWGNNTDPSRVLNVSNIVSISAGLNTSFGLDGSGTVWAWGANYYRQLGFDSSFGGHGNITVPTPTGDTRRVVQVAAGNDHTAFLHSDGTVAVWGKNDRGQYGIGTTSGGSTPGSVSEVPGLSDVVKIVAGQDMTFAIKKDGTLWGWGYADLGKFGSGISAIQILPVQIPGLTDIPVFGLGSENGYVTLPDQTAWAWGDNGSGACGNGTNVDTSVRVRVTKQGINQAQLTGATSIAGGRGFALARLADGTVWSWGRNYEGQLGNGNLNPTNLAGLVPNLTGVASVWAGPTNSFAIMNDGTARAWGEGGGLLGNNSAGGSSTPVPVSNLTTAKTIVCGNNHAQALLTNGTVMSWGSNAKGALGTGPGGDSLVPIPILTLSNVKSIASGASHTLVAKGDGTVWAWGSNDSKQLGDPTLPSSNVPIQVTSLSNIVAVAACYSSSYALRNDGTVWAWGYNGDGELADPLVLETYVPLQVPGIVGATNLYAMDARTYVRKADGTFWGWGLNRRGALGIGTDEYVRSPIEVTR